MLPREDSCTGCTACARICPKECVSLISDKYGFVHPSIDFDLCISCKKCEKVCPVLADKKPSSNTAAYAAFTTDETVRADSSSGGIFSMLANEILAENGVVFGAAFNNDFSVEHICVETQAELWRLRGAKYVQGSLDNTFSEVKRYLENGHKVLFSGLPCQIAGLKSFLGEDNEKLLTVGLICHGVPSPLAWKNYLNYRAKKDNGGVAPKSVNFRSKETGWSYYSFAMVFEYESGARYICKNTEDLFLKLFLGHYILKESCDKCKFKGYNQHSDITLGDFWGIWDVDRSMDDGRGTSAVLVHSKKGEEYFKRIKNIKIKEKQLGDVSKNNFALLSSIAHNPNRKKLLDIIAQGDFKKAEKLLLRDGKFFAKALRFAKNKLSKIGMKKV